MDNKTFYKRMVTLAIPVALQNLLGAAMGIIDTAMITRLGSTATAAVGAAGRWNFLLMLFFFGISSGSAVFIAQYWGIKDLKNIRRSLGFGLVLVFSVSVVFAIFALSMPQKMIQLFITEPEVIEKGASYLRIIAFGWLIWGFNSLFSIGLRSTENVKLPLFASTIGAASNVFLNWVLIFGKLGMPALGVRGAAIATAISYLISAIILLVGIFVTKSPYSHNLSQYFAWDKSFVKKFIVIMSPALINEVIWALGNNMYSVVLGRQGSANYAAYTVYLSAEYLFFTLLIGVCSACAVMVGKAIGAGRIEEGIDISKRFMFIMPAVSAVIGIIIILLRYPLLDLMGIPDMATRNMAATLLFIYALMVPLHQIPYVAIVGIFRAGGDTMTGMWLDIANVWLIGVPVVWILGMVLKVPFQWIFVGVFSEDIIKTIYCIYHYRSKKWIRRLTV